MGTPARVVVLPQTTSQLRIEEITLPDPGPTQVVVNQVRQIIRSLTRTLMKSSG